MADEVKAKAEVAKRQAEMAEAAKAKALEIEKKKAEVRKRLEEQSQKKQKKGFMTPERKKKLRLLLRKKAAEELKKEQERKAAERRKIIDERCGQPKNLEGANEDNLRLILTDYHARIAKIEDQKYDCEMDVMRKDYEINELNIQVNDLRGKFIKPTLKKVSKYENKFAKLQKKAAEFNFRNQLKTVKKKEFELEDDKGAAQKPDWAAGGPGAAKKEGEEGGPEEGEAAKAEVSSPTCYRVQVPPSQKGGNPLQREHPRRELHQSTRKYPQRMRPLLQMLRHLWQRWLRPLGMHLLRLMPIVPLLQLRVLPLRRPQQKVRPHPLQLQTLRQLPRKRKRCFLRSQIPLPALLSCRHHYRHQLHSSSSSPSSPPPSSPAPTSTLGQMDPNKEDQSGQLLRHPQRFSATKRCRSKCAESFFQQSGFTGNVVKTLMLRLNYKNAIHIAGHSDDSIDTTKLAKCFYLITRMYCILIFLICTNCSFIFITKCTSKADLERIVNQPIPVAFVVPSVNFDVSLAIKGFLMYSRIKCFNGYVNLACFTSHCLIPNCTLFLLGRTGLVHFISFVPCRQCSEMLLSSVTEPRQGAYSRRGFLLIVNKTKFSFLYDVTQISVIENDKNIARCCLRCSNKMKLKLLLRHFAILFILFSKCTQSLVENSCNTSWRTHIVLKTIIGRGIIIIVCICSTQTI